MSNNAPMRTTELPAEPPDPMSFIDDDAEGPAPESGTIYPEHPLFPCEDGQPETRDIQFVTFRRRRSDGKVDNCPEDVSAKEVRSWADVIGPWGGGEYKAIGKDKNHRIVAWYPPEKGAWLLFDQPSKPFTLRDGTTYGPGIAPPPPAPAPAPAAAALSPATDPMLLAMFNQMAETNRTILTTVLTGVGGNRDASTWEALRAIRELQPNPLDWLRAVKEMLPASAGAQASVSDQLSTVRALLDLTRPGPTMPEPSILSELGGLFTTVIQGDAAAKATKAPEPTEKRPPPPRAPRLLRVPGLGIVEVVQPEPPVAVAYATPAPAPVAVAPAAPAQPRSFVAPAEPIGAVEPMGMRAPVARVTPSARAPVPAAPPAANVNEPVIDMETLKRNPAALAQLIEALGLEEWFARRGAVGVNGSLAAARPEAVPAEMVHRPGAEASSNASLVAPREMAQPRPPDGGLGSSERRVVHGVAVHPVREAGQPNGAARGSALQSPPNASAAPLHVDREAVPVAPLDSQGMPPVGPTLSGARVALPSAAVFPVPITESPTDRSTLNDFAVQPYAPMPFASSARAAVADVENTPWGTAQARPAPVPQSSSDRVLEWPVQMQDAPPQENENVRVPEADVTSAQREQAQEPTSMLSTIPGMAPFAGDFVRGLADVPAEDLHVLTRLMPPDVLQAIGKLCGKGG